MTTAIGKIVKSNTHIDYVCQVYGPGELVTQPSPTDYAFAEFVAIELNGYGSDNSPGALIGVIYNTLLLNPDFGSLGPRLSPRGEQEIFTPDYLSETATLVGIIALGWREGGGVYRQGVPGLAADVDAPVRRLSDEEICAFHLDGAGRLSLRYASVLMGMNNPLVPQLLLTLIDRLVALFPEQSRQLQVMRNNVAWKSIVQPAG